MDYKFEKITPEKYNDIQSLKHRSMGYVQDMKDIERKFNTSVFGIRDVGFFARNDKNFPAAYYGVFPIRATYRGKDIIIAQSGDTMTDPDHRKKGLFTKLAVETYKYAGENNIGFIFGFPNEFSYPGFKKKLSWGFYDSLQEFSIQSTAFPFCELAKKYPKIRPIYKSIIDKRMKKYLIPLNDENIKDFSFGENDFFIKKDTHFYNYKKGDFKYLVDFNGFKFFIKAQTHLYIGDVGFFNENKIHDFIASLKKLSQKVMSKKVVLSISKTHWLFNYLIKELEPKISLPIGVYKYEVEYPFDEMIITMSDFDTF